MTELTSRIRAKSLPDEHEVQDSANFVSFFPDFVWTLRDFSLELILDGQPITADKYLEYSLKLKQGYWDSWFANKQKKKENSIRMTISMQMLIIIIFKLCYPGCFIRGNETFLR